jgi:hypothetical protein
MKCLEFITLVRRSRPGSPYVPCEQWHTIAVALLVPDCLRWQSTSVQISGFLKTLKENSELQNHVHLNYVRFWLFDCIAGFFFEFEIRVNG